MFYNRFPLLVPCQAILTCFGNITAAYAAYRVAKSNGWELSSLVQATTPLPDQEPNKVELPALRNKESPSLVGFEDLGDALANDNDYTFLLKLFFGCAVASYALKYGEILFDFPFESNVVLALFVIWIPSALNAFKWYKRSQDPTFEGWF